MLGVVKVAFLFTQPETARDYNISPRVEGLFDDIVRRLIQTVI